MLYFSTTTHFESLRKHKEHRMKEKSGATVELKSVRKKCMKRQDNHHVLYTNVG